MKLKSTVIFCFLLIFIFSTGVYGFYWWKDNKYKVSTNNAYVKSSITTISSRISGYIELVPALTNAKVDKDEILVIFDTETFEVEVKASKAAVEVADAKISTIETDFKNISARLDLAKTNIEAVTSKAAALSSELKLANQDLSRIERLYNKKSVSRAKYDKFISHVQTAEHNLNAANSIIKSEKNKLEVILTEKQKIQSQKKELLASLDNAEAKLKLSVINLESTKVLSPIDGIIANRIAEPGIYVEDGWPLMAVVPIHDIWIIANFKETQVEKIKVGQKVNITFDAFKEKPLTGKVQSMAPASSASFSLLPPQNASGNFVKVVQRVPVKITFEVPDEMLGRIVPGLSAVVSVNTDTSLKNSKSSTKISSR